MGIDKACVRLVLHYDWPQSLEALHQESGRAGRDGLHAQCVLIANLQKVPTLLPNDARPPEQARAAPASRASRGAVACNPVYTGCNPVYAACNPVCRSYTGCSHCASQVRACLARQSTLQPPPPRAAATNAHGCRCAPASRDSRRCSATPSSATAAGSATYLATWAR